MLKEERQNKILKLINSNGRMTTVDICEKIGSSEATIRRDLNELDSKGLLVKIFGGARSKKQNTYITIEDNMDTKKNLNINSKNIIGKFAASLVEDNDYIYLDAGTSVLSMLPYLNAKDITIVTNSVEVLNSEYANDLNIYIVSGKYKSRTKSIIGGQAVDYISKCVFTKAFFGTNGVHTHYGFTTPNNNEAIIKESAIKRARQSYVLADKSKIGIISQVVFSDDDKVQVITESDGIAYITNFKEVE